MLGGAQQWVAAASCWADCQAYTLEACCHTFHYSVEAYVSASAAVSQQ